MNQRRVTFADDPKNGTQNHTTNNRPRGPQSSPSVNMMETITPPDSAGEEDMPTRDYGTYIDTEEEEPD